ncbi:MAG TPA: efflux RND transporter permease subunit, partial [Chthonomonadaceae bacterium]|nr:efflux RND transporter permease subunit [Chthonomonadaceae bacterium]
MQWLADICVRRPVFATVLVLGLVVIGAFSYFRLGVDRFPQVDFPVVTIVVREDGASPEEIETDVVDKVEEAVNTVSGIDQLNSYSYDGVAQIVVTFQLEKDINIAVQEVRDKVNGILPDLPLDIKPPVVDKVDPDAVPILELALTAPGSVRDTTEYADKVLRRRLESIQGVGQVTVLGGQKRQINIDLHPAKLQAYNLTAIDVQHALETQNIQIPGGEIDQSTRELTLRTRGRVRTPEEFGDIIITKSGNAVIRVSDVATVVDGVEDADSVADVNGESTVLLSIRKQSGLNTVATVDAIYERLKDVKKILPQGYSIRITRDQALYIKAATRTVQEHLVLGSLLAAMVVLLFLWNFRTTVISAIAIPASIISTFALMNFMGFTLNSITLLALTLSVGIVIDDAIVVLENIYRFIEEKGMKPFEAAIEGTREIGLAVLATTLSLITVFLPIAFMQGIVGRFMSSFGLTMAFAIFVSLIVSFTLTPMLSSRWIKPPKRSTAAETESSDALPVETDGGHAGGSSSKETGIFKPIDAVYAWLLRWSMRHRWAIVLLCILTLVSTVPLFGAVGKDFLPNDDESQLQITMRTPEGTSLSSTQQTSDAIAAAVREFPSVDYVVVTIGDNNQKTRNLAAIFVKLKDPELRPGKIPQQEVMQQVRKKVTSLFPDLRISVDRVAAFSTGASNALISFFIGGPDLDKLEQYSQQVVTELKKVPGATDVDTSLIVGKPELSLDIDRQRAGDLGVSVSDIANTGRIMVGGLKVSDYYEKGEQYEVHLRAELSQRRDWDAISLMTVPTSSPGRTVRLMDVASANNETGPAQITRQDRRRNVLITCNILPGYSQSTVSTRLEQIIKDLHMPPDYT